MGYEDECCKVLSGEAIQLVIDKTQVEVEVIDNTQVEAEVIDNAQVEVEIIDNTQVEAEVIDNTQVEAEVINNTQVEAEVIENTQVEAVDKFVFVGSVGTSDVIARRIASSAFGRLKESVWRRGDVSQRLKMRLFKALIVLYMEQRHGR